jgi:NitT/TauT family transport system substrate-binding protein
VAWRCVPRTGGRPEPLRRRSLAALAACGLLPWLAGCGEPDAPLNVGTIVFPGYELLFLARESGLLKAADGRLVELLSSTDNLRLMEDGRLDAATLTLDEVLGLRSRGVDLRIVAVLDVSDGADALMARGGISTLAELKGRRLGVEDSAMGAVMFDAVLQAADLHLEDVVKVPITADQAVAAFQAETVDAVITFEPWVSQLEALGAVRIFDSAQVPDRVVDVLAVKASVIEKRPAAVGRLVAAHFEALTRYRADPAAASAVMAARLQVEPAEVPASFKGLRLPDAEGNRAVLREGGRFHLAVRSIQAMMIERRLLDSGIPLDGLVDTRFLPEPRG